MPDELTRDQRAAVTHPGGPLLVLAGAGAGKTRALCHRLAWLVDGGAAPAEILGLTFSREAAEELRGRAEALIGRSHETLRVMTFHSLAMEICRVHGVDRGLLAPTSVATDDDRAIMLMERLEELPIAETDLRLDRGMLVDDWIRRINRCRDQLVTPERYVAWAEEAVRSAARPADAARMRRELEFARIFRLHDRWLEEAGLEDFGWSIVRALELLRRHPDRAAAARAGARHLLVDEFQDTNHAQAELLYLLAEGSESLVVVGDDDQGIYRFRGASTKNVTDFRDRFPEAREVLLELNHRSTQVILDAAHAVVAPIPDRSPKRLRALAGAEGPPPAPWVGDDEDAVARAVADEVARLAEAGTPYEEMAVLMRSVKNEAPRVVEALERAGVPHQVRGGLGLFDRREVRTALAWCRALVDRGDAQAHLRLAADRELGIPWARAAEAVSESAAAGGSATAALLAVAQEASAPALAALLDAIGPATTGDAADFLREVIDRTGLRRGALALGGAEGAARLAGLAGMERLAGDLVRRHPDLDPAGLTARLTRLAEIGFKGSVNPGGEREGVQVMTIHASKGLEFDAVLVIGLTAGNLPGRERRGSDIPDQLLPEVLPRGRDANVAEARRLTYVAMTRARRTLVLATHRTASATGFGQRPSPFFEEALAAIGGPEPREVGASADAALLDEVGRAHRAFEEASLRAARAAAAAAPDAGALAGETRAAADALVAARARALSPPAAPQAPPGITRPARPGVTISPTDIERYRTCPLAYRFARVDRIPQRPSPARAIGVAAHAALEAHHRPDGPGGDADSLVARFARELMRAGVHGTPEGRQALARAREWLPRYHERTRRQSRETVSVERPFTLTLGPHVVRGRIDRLDAHPGGGHQIVDYKTGRPPASDSPAESLVLHIYMAGAYESFDAVPKGATLEYVLDGDTRQVNPDGAEVRTRLAEARAIADRIAAREFPAAPGWACRSCDFALICPAMDR